MGLRRSCTGALLACAGAAAGAAVHCAPPRHADCPSICTALDSCHFLPSVLGSSDSDDAGDGDLLGSCNERCNLSSEPGPFTEIDDCWHEATAAESLCPSFASCLHGDFPSSPITGAAQVTLSADTTDAGEGGAPLGGCQADAGPGGLVAQAFVEEWGVRTCSPTVTCSPDLLFVFEDVPAAPMVRMGIQLRGSGFCYEYDAVNDVNAGSTGGAAKYPISLEGTPSCPSAAASSCTGGDASADGPEGE